MAVLYRICGRAWLPQDPTGAARSTEGRWHVMGQRVLYLSSSLALCVLELRANAISFATIRERFHFSSVEVPPDHTETLHSSFYPHDWSADKAASQTMGRRWYQRQASLGLMVRSAVLPLELNCIVNTTHQDFGKLHFSRPHAIPLDPRVG